MALYKNNRQDGSTILIAGVGSGGSIDIDSIFDSTSINPVQNKVITAQFDIIDNILYKRYNSIVSKDGNLILNIDKQLKLYDKILFPVTVTQQEIIITYKNNKKENIIINKENNPVIFVEDSFSSIEIPENFTATIYRCVDENEVRKLQNAFSQLEKQFNDTQTELTQTGILVPNLVYDSNFSFGIIEEDGTELNNKTGILTSFFSTKNTDIIMKSFNTEIVIRTKYEDDNEEFHVESYSLNQKNNYIQKITFDANVEYKIGFSYPSVIEISDITDIANKINMYAPNIIITTGNVPISNGDGTWSWNALSFDNDYTSAKNKPSIGGVELSGNKTLNELGVASASEVAALNTTVKLLSNNIETNYLKKTEIATQTKNITWNGLKIIFYRQGDIAWMRATGTLSTDLSISNAYADMIVAPDEFKPTVSDSMDIISGLYKFRVDAVEGTGFHLGQGKMLSEGTNTNITAGTDLYFNRVYMC